MSAIDLDKLEPSVRRFVERMIASDPDYGACEHQGQFVAMFDEIQRRYPCTRDHSKDPFGEHLPACYADEQWKQIYAWQKDRTNGHPTS